LKQVSQNDFPRFAFLDLSFHELASHSFFTDTYRHLLTREDSQYEEMVRLTQQLFTLFTALSFLGSASASPLEATSTTTLSSRNGASDSLAKRDQLTSGTLCASVGIKIQVGNKRHVST
jgi:hypothetical protein